MHKRKKILANEQGFTLIEIIAVLVLLGILAAVAVPKYMDLTGEARKKAAVSGVTEFNSRAQLNLAKYMLNSTTTPNPNIFSNDLGDDLTLYDNQATPVIIADSDTYTFAAGTYNICVDADTDNLLATVYTAAVTTAGSEVAGNFSH